MGHMKELSEAKALAERLAALLPADDERQTTCTDCPRCGDHVRTSDLRQWQVCEQTHMEPAEYEDGCTRCWREEDQ